jgi:hypothetical protein
MSPQEKQGLVAGYIEHNRRSHAWGSDNVLREVKGEDNFWAFEKLDELCRTDPDTSWDVILDILHTPHDDAVTAVLAAGPLEDLLGNFGAEVIGRVEERSKSDAAFKDLLGGVWPGRIPKDVWARVESCRGETW